MKTPISLIIDTDMGNDIDDALALALCHTLQTQGHCRLVGVTLCKDDPYAATYTSIVNSFYGRKDIPIGIVKGGDKGKTNTYIHRISEMRDISGNYLYPRTLSPQDSSEDSVTLLRKLLSSQPDQSVVIVMIGFSTNMARLLDTRPDDISPLTGTGLFRDKVKFVSAMAADFSDEVQLNPTMKNREFNIRVDIPSAQRFFNHCPVDVVFSGYEIGCAIPYPAESIDADYGWTQHHPVADAYKVYGKMPYDRPSWDPSSVLYAVCPDAGHFGLSQRGTAKVDDNGFVLFKESLTGRHRHLTVNRDQVLKLKSMFTTLCSWPTNGQPKHPRDPVKIVGCDTSGRRISQVVSSSVND